MIEDICKSQREEAQAFHSSMNPSESLWEAPRDMMGNW